MSRPENAPRFVSSLPPDLAREGEPVFGEPWQAQAFAMAVKLHQEGIYSWSEWTRALADEIASGDREHEADAGTRYYLSWLAALEKLVVAKGLGSGAELGELRAAWRTAYLDTPHGHPVSLKPGV